MLYQIQFGVRITAFDDNVELGGDIEVQVSAESKGSARLKFQKALQRTIDQQEGRETLTKD